MYFNRPGIEANVKQASPFFICISDSKLSISSFDKYCVNEFSATDFSLKMLKLPTHSMLYHRIIVILTD